MRKLANYLLGRVKERGTGMCVAAVAGWMVLATTGCATGTGVRQRLDSGYAAMQANQYQQALGIADDVLRTNGQGAGAAEAYYLRGRALEERAIAQPSRSAADLESARLAYINASQTVKDNPALLGLILEGVGNVAYYQDDYQTAAEQLGAAYDKLQRPDDRAWDLYRMGVAQQRLGRFADADRAFTSVEQQFAGTEQARRAGQHRGATGFFVQIPFATPQEATGSLADLHRRGLTASAGPEPATNRPTARVGPYRDYRAAAAARTALAASYAGAIVIP